MRCQQFNGILRTLVAQSVTPGHGNQRLQRVEDETGCLLAGKILPDNFAQHFRFADFFQRRRSFILTFQEDEGADRQAL